MPIVQTRLTPTQKRIVGDMQRNPERPLYVRYLDGTKLRSVQALERKGLLTVKDRDGFGVAYLLTEEGRGPEGTP